MKHSRASGAGALALLLFAFPLASPAAAQEKTIRMDPLLDGIALGVGGSAAFATWLFTGSETTTRPTADRSKLPAIDAAAIFPLDQGLSDISLGLALGAIAAPASLALVAERDEILPAALACAEALAFTYAAKDLAKIAFPKARPYVYGDAALEGEDLAEALESFPSGHTALAFCSAAYLATVALGIARDRPATPWLVAGSCGLALGTGVLRVLSGKHFPTDAAAGAAIGSGIGWLAARAHLAECDGASTSTSRKGLGLGIAPTAVIATIRM